MAFNLYDAHRLIQSKNEEFESANEELNQTVEELERKNQELIESHNEIIKRELMHKESEEKYRGLYDSMKDGVVLVNTEGQIMECNGAYLNLLGYTYNEIKRLTYIQLTPLKWHEMEAQIVNEQIRYCRGVIQMNTKRNILKRRNNISNIVDNMAY